MVEQDSTPWAIFSMGAVLMRGAHVDSTRNGNLATIKALRYYNRSLRALEERFKRLHTYQYVLDTCEASDDTHKV